MTGQFLGFAHISLAIPQLTLKLLQTWSQLGILLFLYSLWVISPSPSKTDDIQLNLSSTLNQHVHLHSQVPFSTWLTSILNSAHPTDFDFYLLPLKYLSSLSLLHLSNFKMYVKHFENTKLNVSLVFFMIEFWNWRMKTNLEVECLIDM